MKQVNNVPWEALVLLGLIIFLVVAPFFIGMGTLKLYRCWRPIQKNENVSAALITEEEGDSFPKMFFVGWLITAPILYFLYQEFHWVFYRV